MVKFVSDLRQVGGFHQVLRFSPGPSIFSTNKTDNHNITEILLKVTFNTINLNLFVLSMFCRSLQMLFCFIAP